MILDHGEDYCPSDGTAMHSHSCLFHFDFILSPGDLKEVKLTLAQ